MATDIGRYVDTKRVEQKVWSVNLGKAGRL